MEKVCIPVLLILLSSSLSGAASPDPPAPPPNIVIIFTDDQGYGDVGAYGATGFQTPNLDRMAREGVRFTDFYVAQSACSASRAALLTGTYPNRIGIHGALGPRVKTGINSGEVTIAEMLKERGYATAIFGKWHLGRPEQFLPTRHGFDEYFGLPYSNDMIPFRPGVAKDYPDLPLIEGEKVIALNPDQSKLTRQYTQRAEHFIRRNRGRPFFLYVPHNMPHVPISVSGKFKGRSEQGLYGDVISEIDWSVGRILAAIRKNGLDRRTLVIFASDNGPWLGYGDHAGSAGPLREGKATTWEGGIRVPAIMRWPGRIPANSLCREPVMTIDLLPTIAGITSASLPAHHIDGLDIWPLIIGTEGARSPHQAYFFYNRRNELQALRSGRWKLHLPHMYWTLGGREPGSGGSPGRYSYVETQLGLYDLHSDIGEANNVAAEHLQVVERLLALAELARKDMGDSLTDRQGENVREPGRVQE